MNIEPLIRREIVSIGPDHTVAEAARRMGAGRVGSAVVITEDGSPAIITERDILLAITDGADLERARVAEYMTPNAITATASWDVDTAARAMAEGGFRHLIVVTETGGVAGVLSIRDLVVPLLNEVARPPA
jgi:CBS domain-containing protein